jgi:hypothetical protein
LRPRRTALADACNQLPTVAGTGAGIVATCSKATATTSNNIEREVLTLPMTIVDECVFGFLLRRSYSQQRRPRDPAQTILIDSIGDSPVNEPRGFLIPDVERQQLGELIIAYATLQGEVAYDGLEANSPFTTAFLKHVEDEGIDVDHFFRIVRDDVLSATKGAQKPAIESYRGQRSFVLRPTVERSGTAAK